MTYWRHACQLGKRRTTFGAYMLWLDAVDFSSQLPVASLQFVEAEAGNRLETGNWELETLNQWWKPSGDGGEGL